MGSGDDDWLSGFAPAFHRDFAITANSAGHHAGGVERRGDVALVVESDYAAFAVLVNEFLHHHIACGLLERNVQVADALANVSSHDIAHGNAPVPVAETPQLSLLA